MLFRSVMDGQTGYIVERGDEKQLADAIVKYYQCGMEETFAANVRREAYRFSWDRLAEKVDAVLERCEDG